MICMWNTLIYVEVCWLFWLQSKWIARTSIAIDNNNWCVERIINFKIVKLSYILEWGYRYFT